MTFLHSAATETLMTHEQWDRERLRHEASRLLRRSTGELNEIPPSDVRELVRELQLYQTELEEQNDELRRLQSELEESRDRYSDLYDFAPVGYLSVEPDNSIGAANVVAAELFEVARERLIGSFLTEHVDRQCRDELIEHLNRTRETRRNQVCDVRLHSDSSPVYVRLLTDVIAGADGPHPTLRIALSNISEEKAAEFDAERRARHKRRAERHQSLGGIAGGFARDINQLLAPIMAQATIVADGLEAGSPDQERLQRIIASSEVAARLCGTMLSFSDPPSQFDSRVDIEDFAQTLPGWLSEEIPEAKLTVSCAAVGEVVGDRSQLECAFRAVSQNAVEATSGKEAQLAIDIFETNLSQEDIEGLLSAEEAQPGAFCAFALSDNGGGISPEHLEQILSPLFSTRGQGRGIGLALVREIVSIHRGGLGVSSRPEEGTTLTIYLPIARSPAIGPSIFRSAEFVTGEGRVLLIEPDDEICNSTKCVLEAAGYEVDVANGFADAVALHRENWPNIDVILLDAQASEFDAIRTLVELRRHNDTAIVAIRTGGRRALTPEDLSRLGAACVIRKPCSAFELTRKLKAAANYTQADE